MKEIFSSLNKTVFQLPSFKYRIFTFISIIGLTSNLFAQTVPCDQRVIDNADFTYTGSGTAPARWNINQADTGNAHLDQTAFSYVASGSFANVATNFDGSGTNNTTRQYAVVTNPNTLSPQYANIPTDGMLVINPLQGQNDQYLTYSLGGLVPGNTYNIEIKVWNVLDLAYPGACQSWCNWNDQLFIDMQNNQVGAEHSNQTGQNWTGTNGSGTWSQGTNQVNNILKVSSGGAYAIITGSMTMPASGNTLTITLAKGNSSNAVVLGVDYIKVYGCQQEAINISGGTPNVCEASQFTLTAQGIGPAGSTYQWYQNGVLLIGRTSDTLNIVSGIVAGAQDIYKAVGQWDTVSDTLIAKLCCSSVGGTSNEVIRQSFNGLTYTCPTGGTPDGSRHGGYADIPDKGTKNFIDPSYVYAGIGCNSLNDGQYAVVQSSYAGNYWQNRPEVKDHTGVPGSGALFINAIGGAGQVFYKFSLSGLCTGTTYEFSVWYASLATGSEIKPDIEFDVVDSITGTKIATTNTGVIPINEQWYEADVTFTTPTTGAPSYTFEAANLVSGSGGNDLMLDDIVVQKCNPAINLYEDGTTDSVVSVCDNNPVSLKVSTFYDLPLEITGSSGGTVYYQWMSATSPGGPWTLLGTPVTTGTFSAIPIPTTTYYRAKVSSSSANAATGLPPVATDCGNDGMTYSFTLTKGGNFTIPPITGTTAYCVGNTLTLTGDPGTGSQWEWLKGTLFGTATVISSYEYSNNAANKVYSKTFALADTGTYYFSAETAAGCESYSSVTVKANTLPAVTPAATAASVCTSSSAQISSLTYTTVTGAPTNYTITWDAAGIAAGLINVGSTTLPASPITLNIPANTAAGTYTGTITVTNAGGCAGTGTTFTLTVNQLPTISVASTADSLCVSSSTQTSGLAYTATTGTPTKYSITWNGVGISAGLANVANSALPSSPISINVPANTAAGTYTGTITVTNAGGCAGTGTTFTLTVNDIIGPNDISCGNATNNSVSFNWSGVVNATSYTITHTVNGGPSINDPSSGTAAYLSYYINSLNPGDVVVITVLPVGTGTSCFKSASFTCKTTTCPTVNLPVISDITACSNIQETVTLTGAGFTYTWANSNPAIGLAAASAGSSNSPLIIAFTTANPTSAVITGEVKIIATSGICNYPDSFKVTVNPDAIPTLTSAATSNAQTVCINKAISNITYSITGTGNNATASGLPNGVTGLYAGRIFTISGTPTQNGTYNYTVTGTGTCGNGTATGMITVTGLPVINSVTPTNPSSCGGSDGSFIINGLTASSSYTVNFIKDGTAQAAQMLTSDNSGNVVVGSLKQGAYTGITVTSAGGCTSAAATTNLSDPSVFNPVASSNSPCVGSTLNLISTTSNDPSAIYAWAGPNGYTASGATPSIPSTTVGMSGNYIVKATVSGCTSSSTVTVTINPAPSSPIGTSVSICGGGNVTLSASLSGVITDALTWYSDAALTMQVATGISFPIPNLTTTTPYYVTETNINSCVSTATTVTATVNPVPSLPTVNSTSICGNGMSDLSATPFAPGDTLKWYSDPALTTLVNNGTSYLTPAINATTYYYITETSTSACTSTSAATITATVEATPLAPTANDISYCQGDVAVPLTASGTNTLVWFTLSQGGNAAATPPTPSTATSGTTIFYVASNNGTCEGPRTPLTVTVKPISAYAGGPVVDVDQGQPFTLNGKGTGDSITISWAPAIYLSSTTVENPIVTPLESTTYTMQVNSSDGCKASDTVQVISLKSVIIPNAFSPNGDGINDTWVIRYLDEYATATVSIFNRYGQLIFESSGGSYSGQPWNGTYNGSPVPVGTYYYIIKLTDSKKPLSGSISVIR